MYNLVWFGRYDYFVKLNMETKPFKKRKKERKGEKRQLAAPRSPDRICC